MKFVTNSSPPLLGPRHWLFSTLYPSSTMVLSFLFYRADRKSPLSHSILPSIWLYLCSHTCYTLLFLLFCFLLLCLFNSMLLCNTHTTYCIAAPYSGIPTPDFPRSSSFCNHIPCILQKSPLLSVLSIFPCSLLPLLVAILLPYCALSPSPIPLALAPLPPFFSFLSSLDTLTSCVLLPHT